MVICFDSLIDYYRQKEQKEKLLEARMRALAGEEADK